MTVLYILLYWAFIAIAIYLKRKWNHKYTLKDLTRRLLFVFVINFLLCPFCIYGNLKYFIKKIFKSKPLKKCSPLYSLVTQSAH